MTKKQNKVSNLLFICLKYYTIKQQYKSVFYKMPKYFPVFYKTTSYNQSYPKTNEIEEPFTMSLRAIRRFMKRLKSSVEL